MPIEQWTDGARQYPRCRRTLCLAWLLAWVAPSLGAESLDLPLNRWRFHAKGNFAGRLDRRNLYQIAHPLDPADAGDYGRVETQVSVPEGMEPPYTLRFYVSGNIYGQGHSKRSVVDLRVGHRFKQALVNGKVVWSQDIAVNTPVTGPRYTLVDITPHVRPGQSFTLALQLWQEVHSKRHMPDDLIQLGIYAGTTKQYEPLPRERYGTQSYWGDVAIHAGAPPAAKALVCRWEPALRKKNIQFPRVRPAGREQATLRVERGELLTAPWSWPVTQGIPLPMAALKYVKNMALRGPKGETVCAQFAPLSRWPDGSLRWVLVEFALPASSGKDYRLEWGSEVAASAGVPASPVRWEEDFHMSNGLVWARWAQNKDLVIGRPGGQVVVNGMGPYLNFKTKALQPKWLAAGWLSRSSHRAEMQVTGELVAEDGERYGACRLRLAMFADSPLMRVMYTITNERIDAAPEDVPDHETIRRTRGLYGGVRPLTAVVTSYGLRLLVPGAKAREKGEGWVAVEGQGGAVVAAVRYFKHVWPVGLECQAGGIDFQLFKPGDKRMPTYATYAGEAKTHEIWLAVTDSAPSAASAANLAERVETPPRLDTSALIRGSHVWGAVPRVGPSTHTAEYAMIVERYLDPWYANTHQDTRHYGGYSGHNFYWNRLHSIYLLYAMTGERKWYDRAERSVRHYMDVCTLNWWPDGSKVGAKVRNVDKFFAVYLVHQNPHPMFDHWNLTGDPDGLRLARANADFVMDNAKMRSGTKGKSARAQGWPLMGMVRAWQETGDARYAAHAKHIVDVALNHMEPRRGAYLQRHGSNSHLGIVPFMTGILCTGLRQYHFWTGDDRAGVAVVQNAEAMFAEMHDPLCSQTLPNLDYYYSPNPYLRSTNGKTPIAHLNPNIAAAQAYAAYLRDDPELADIAWRTWEAYMQTAGWRRNSYDYLYDLHAALYWLDKAPVPDRTSQIKVGRFWRHGVGAPEIWIDRPDGRPFSAQVAWTAHREPFYRGQAIPQWPAYCQKHAVRGEVQLLDPKGRAVAAAPMDFAKTPYGASVSLEAGVGEPGLYRIVPRGAGAFPASVIPQDLSPHVQRWGMPIDRGWLCEASDYYFRIPADCQEISLRYGLLTPWENISVALLGSDGRKIKERRHDQADRWQSSWLTWKVPVPPEVRGQIWCFRQSPPAGAILRIDGVGPLASLEPDALFTPASVPPPPSLVAQDAPPQWSEEVACIEPGKKLSIPRGPKTGEGQYQHVHVRQGTIEFWMRADTSDDSMANLTFFAFGRLRLWRRTQIGTYYNLGKGFLQSGFLFRPRAWYHVALTWDLGDEQRQPAMALLIGGVPMVSRMQTRLPADTGDWTGPALAFGSVAAMRITGLRISSTARDHELQKGALSPPPDAQTLYWQHAKTVR